jgi:oligogalacturonide lyase
MLLGVLGESLRTAIARGNQRTQPLPRAGEFVRFADPTTETPVVRLTSPAYNNLLPAPTNRFLLLKPRLLFCSSDRASGRMAPFEIDLRTGAIRQVAETGALDVTSLTVDAQGHYLYFLDGGALSAVSIVGKKEIRRAEVLAKDITAFGPGAGRSEFFAIANGQLRYLHRDDSTVLADAATGPCLARPGGTGCLFYRSGSELWYAPAASTTGKPVMIAQGKVSSPCWSADGSSVLFLRDVPTNQVFVSEIHEVKPEEGKERCIAKTSQFTTLMPNGNGSVFVGASGSKAQPNVILLLRSTQRELTLCEHRATHPSDVRPTFSPDSRRVYFQSDREGKSAIYSVNVEQLVEPTGG